MAMLKIPRDLAQARVLQERLAQQVILADDLGRGRTVAGVDVHYSKNPSLAWASVAVLSFPGLELLETASASAKTVFPYVPGYLSFREVPAALAALNKLAKPPALLLCDGQGLAHPRALGLACHLGLASGLPAIGVAKSRLVGDFKPPGRKKGAWEPLFWQDRVVGGVLRTRQDVHPVFVSPGHRVSLPTALVITLACTTAFRQPEPLRRAHHLAQRGAKAALGEKGANLAKKT